MNHLLNDVRQFAHEHDDVPAFHAGYLVLTVLFAALFNLGFYALLIFSHMALDFVKYRDVHGYSLKKTFKAMLLESIGDIALFMLALTFAVYLNHTYMLAAMSGMLRSELSVLRLLGTLLPKIRITENLLAILLNINGYMHSVHPGINVPMTRIQHWSLGTILICSCLLVLAVIIYSSNSWDLMAVLAHELIPAI